MVKGLSQIRFSGKIVSSLSDQVTEHVSGVNKLLSRMRKIVADHILKTRTKLNKILAENTGQDLSVIEVDTERDNYMSAEEAKAYGLIDEVIIKH